MKILHVVTFFDSSRSYGGPLSVALNLAKEQINQGHSVSLTALSESTFEMVEDGVKIHAFQATKLLGGLRFSSMFSVSGINWLRLNLVKYDAIHFHFSRDIFQVASALVASWKFRDVFLQTHGMLTNSETSKRLGERIYDCVLVKPILKRANQVLALHQIEKKALLELCPTSKVVILPNGIHFGKFEATQPERIRVAFISRLHSQKNPLLFVFAAKKIINSVARVSFIIAGPDGGEASEVEREVRSFNSKYLQYLGPLDHETVKQTLKSTTLLVLPSVNDPYPMIILEALSNGVPVVVTTSCQIAPEIIACDLGEVADPTVEEVANAVMVRLAKLNSRYKIYDSARNLFDITQVVASLTNVYMSEASNPG